MSYIGKNPKVDSVKLEGSATAASGTEEGQLYYNTGTGSISKGLKVFKNSQFVAIDKQLGDADTFHLLKAADISTAEFSAARNSTSTSFLNQNAVPFETTTASGVAGTFSNSSTGDALLTDESADLVFAYKSSGTSDDAQEYFGIPLSVPKAFRGGNIVLSFEYRTGFGTGTTATVDGDFEVSVLDKSSGNGGQTTSTNSTTDIAAGSAITVASKTGLAVGQRIRLEAGSQAAIGNPDATVVEAFITSVSSTANEITISEDWDTPHASGAVVVSGWLTDVVPGQIPAADSQTNKQGKKFSIQFKTEEDTSDIVLFFQNKNTSSTISRHLFVDNILFSANKFLQASSQLPQIVYAADQPATNSYADNTGMLGLGDALMTGGTMEFGSQQEFDKFMTISGSPTKFEVHRDCEIHFYFSGHTATANRFLSLYKNTTTISADGYFVGGAVPDVSTTTFGQIDTHFRFKAGDFFCLAIGDMGGGSTATMNASSQRTQLRIGIKPVQSDVILLESQDEIFTDWQDYTPTISGWSTTANVNFKWRRNGSNMEIIGYFSWGTADASPAIINLPSGYAADTTTLNGHKSFLGTWYRNNGGGNYIQNQYTGPLVYNASDTDGMYFSFAADGDTGFDHCNANAIFGGTESLSLRAVVPIQGWNANFNPLLSMPLVNFGTFSNTYSAKITNGGTAAVASTSEPFIASATRNSAGVVTVVFNTDHFGQVPCIAVAGDTNSTTNEFIVSVDSLTASQTVIRTSLDNGVETDGDFWITLTRQGSDFKPLPQPTAAVIKPAVARITQVKGQGSDGGNISQFAYVDRECNVFEGETWFVTPGTGTLGSGGTCVSFTLQAGTYEVSIEGCARECSTNFLRLLNNTDSTTTIQGRNSFSDSTTNNAMPVSSAKGVFTIAAAKEFKIQHYAIIAKSTSGQGLGIGSGSTNNPSTSIHMEAIIKKLK